MDVVFILFNKDNSIKLCTMQRNKKRGLGVLGDIDQGRR